MSKSLLQRDAEAEAEYYARQPRDMTPERTVATAPKSSGKSLLQRDAEFEAEYYAKQQRDMTPESIVFDEEERPKTMAHHDRGRHRNHQQQHEKSGCSNWGCKLPAKGCCNCCRKVGYCSRKCQVAHYGEHVQVDGCVSCVQDVPGAVFWTVETEVGQSRGERDESWEPVDMMHARADAYGRVASFVHNRDLIAAAASKEPFHAKDVPPGDLRTNQVGGGRARRDHGVEARVYMSITAAQGPDIQFPTLDGTQSIDLPSHDVVSLVNDGGTTVQLRQGELHRAIGDRPIAARGVVVVGMQIGSSRWQLWGAYDLVEAEQNGASGLVQEVRKGTIDLTRRALGHRHRVVRIRGEDQNGVRASLTFKRHSSAEYGPDASYQLESFRIHVPKTGGRTEHRWYSASDIRDSPISPDQESLVTTLSGLPRDLLDAGADTLNVPGNLMEAAADALDMETSITFEPTDPENRIHISALVGWLADHQQGLSTEYVGAQMKAPAEESKRVHVQLNDVSRMRSVLERHIQTLKAEEAGLQVPENISSEVMAAIGRTEELIGANDIRKWGTRRGETARIRKSAKTMSEEQAVAAFVAALESAESEQAFGNVGSQWIERAKIYRERVSVLGATRRLAEYGKRFQAIEAQERARRRGKHQRARQYEGTADAEEFERERKGE